MFVDALIYEISFWITETLWFAQVVFIQFGSQDYPRVLFTKIRYMNKGVPVVLNPLLTAAWRETGEVCNIVYIELHYCWIISAHMYRSSKHPQRCSQCPNAVFRVYVYICVWGWGVCLSLLVLRNPCLVRLGGRNLRHSAPIEMPFPMIPCFAKSQILDSG